jgi:hypothetical protein
MLQINFNLKVVASLFVGLIIGALMTHKIPESKAQSSSITGKYGCIENVNSLPYVTAFTGRSQTTYLNALYSMDFDTGIKSGVQTTINNFNGSSPTRSNESGSLSFTVNPGPVAGMIQINNSSGGYNTTFMAVNSGNTLLGVDTQTETNGQPMNIVCQKI